MLNRFHQSIPSKAEEAIRVKPRFGPLPPLPAKEAEAAPDRGASQEAGGEIGRRAHKRLAEKPSFGSTPPTYRCSSH